MAKKPKSPSRAKNSETPKLRRKTPLFAILLVVFCTFLTSSGQLLLKVGTQNLSFDLLALMTNFPLIMGCVLYGIGAIILIIALKYGDLSVLYPFIALSFVWVMLFSIYFLQEHVSAFNWFGIAAILIGVSLIGKGGS